MPVDAKNTSPVSTSSVYRAPPRAPQNSESKSPFAGSLKGAKRSPEKPSHPEIEIFKRLVESGSMTPEKCEQRTKEVLRQKNLIPSAPKPGTGENVAKLAALYESDKRLTTCITRIKALNKALVDSKKMTPTTFVIHAMNTFNEVLGTPPQSELAHHESVRYQLLLDNETITKERFNNLCLQIDSSESKNTTPVDQNLTGAEHSESDAQQSKKVDQSSVLPKSDKPAVPPQSPSLKRRNAPMESQRQTPVVQSSNHQPSNVAKPAPSSNTGQRAGHVAGMAARFERASATQKPVSTTPPTTPQTDAAPTEATEPLRQAEFAQSQTLNVAREDSSLLQVNPELPTETPATENDPNDTQVSHREHEDGEGWGSMTHFKRHELQPQFGGNAQQAVETLAKEDDQAVKTLARGADAPLPKIAPQKKQVSSEIKEKQKLLNLASLGKNQTPQPSQQAVSETHTSAEFNEGKAKPEVSLPFSGVKQTPQPSQQVAPPEAPQKLTLEELLNIYNGNPPPQRVPNPQTNKKSSPSLFNSLWTTVLTTIEETFPRVFSMLRGLFLSASTDNTMTFFTKIPVPQATSVPVPTAAAVAPSEPAVVAPSEPAVVAPSPVSTSVNQAVVSEPAVSTIPTPPPPPPPGWKAAPVVSTSVNQAVVSEPAVSTIPTPEGWQPSPTVSASVNQAVASNTGIENNAPSTTSATTTNPLFAELQNSLAERRPMIASLPPKDGQPSPAVSASVNQAVASDTGMENNAPRTTSSPTNSLSAELKSRLAERRQKIAFYPED